MAGWIDRDTYEAADGRMFAIFSEQVRGEARFYWPMEATKLAPGYAQWRDIPPDGSYDPRVVARRIERYAAETAAA